MRRFLEFIVTEALENRAGGLKEYAIGLAVFDRPSSFEPASDPIVRVEARRLRTKLAKYYDKEGRADETLIDLPKGQYSPVFRQSSQNGAPARQASTPRNSIAVLPFEALARPAEGASSEEQYFADGLTWELVHQLTRVEGISVVAWHSAQKVRGAVDPVRAGTALNASTVLVGSVRRAGQELRIMAQLMDASSGLMLWSEVFDRCINDILEVQDDIARAIVSRLRAHMGIAVAAPEIRSSYNVEAYQEYLRGRARLAERTPEGIRASIDFFKRTCEIDPRFALGYAGLADAYALLADYAMERSVLVLPDAKRAAEKALEIDPMLGEAHATLAFLLVLHERKWTEAEAHFRRAIALNPGYASAHHWFGVDFLGNLGRFDEGLSELNVARQLDPLSLIMSDSYGHTLLLARRYQEALEHLTLMCEKEPGFYKFHTTLGRVLLHMGRYEESIASFNRGRELVGDFPSVLGALVQAHALNGDLAGAHAMRNRLLELGRGRHIPFVTMAIAHIGLNEHGAALSALERAFEQEETALSSLKVHPVYDCLRGEARFQRLLDRLNLA